MSLSHGYIGVFCSINADILESALQNF